MTNRLALTILFCAAAAFAAVAAPCGVFLSAAAGPLLGLDRPFRGAELETSLELGLGEVSAARAEGTGVALGSASGDKSSGIASAFTLGAVFGASWDKGLAAFLGRVTLRVAFADCFAIEGGWEIPLTPEGPAIEVAGTGAVIGLEPAGILCRLGFSAVLARLTSGRAARPEVLLSGRLSWTAFRAIGVEGDTDSGKALAETLAGSAGFAAGFRAAVVIECRWRANGTSRPARP
jgi:hypothetical protein